MDLLLPWSFSRTSTASLNAWTTCITHTSLGISSRSELSSKTIDKYSLRLKTKEVVKYSLRTILSKQAIRKKRLPLVMVVKTLLILHCKVIYFCLKELLLCRFIYALRRNYLNLLLVSSSWASTKAMTSTTLLKKQINLHFFQCCTEACDCKLRHLLFINFWYLLKWILKKLKNIKSV